MLLLVAASLLHARPVDKGGLFWRKLQVPAEAKDAASVTANFFLPAECKGYAVYKANGQAVKTRLLHQEGGFTKVFFNSDAPGELWLAYLKDQKDGTHDKPLAHVSGLLHVVRRAKEPFGGVDSPGTFFKRWEAAVFEGARFEDTVFSGFNPFGDDRNSLHVYEGGIRIAKPGTYRFYSASIDASFIQIDGKTVVESPGLHDPWKGANNGVFGDVDLKEGVHSFRYLHANSGDALIAVAGILLPGEKRNGVIPKEMFSEVFKAQPGPLEDKDGRPALEFSWDNRQMVYFPETCIHEVDFFAAVPQGVDVKKVKWDFGDGTSGEGAKVTHMFFKRWTYVVTAAAELADGTQMKQTQDVQVNYRFGQNENDDNVTLGMLNRSVQQESSIGVQPEGYDAIMECMIFYKQKKEAEAFYQKSALTKKSPASAFFFDFLDKLVVLQMWEAENYGGAAGAWDDFIKRAEEPLKSRALLRKAQLLAGPLGEHQAAVMTIDQIKTDSLTDTEKRNQLFARADVALHNEGLNAAVGVLAPAAQAGSAKDLRAMLDRENSANAKLFLVEQLIISGKHQEALDNIAALEAENPYLRLYAPLALMKGRILAALGRQVFSAKILQAGLLLEPDEGTEARIRLELARLYIARKEYISARQQLSTIRKIRPGSVEEIEASKLMDLIKKNLEL